MARITAKVDDQGLANRVGRELTRFKHDVASVRREIGEDAEVIFAAHAPKGESGRLFRGIKARTIGEDIVIEATARDPESGYDYVGVTRFGHKVLKIYPGRVARSTASAVRITSHGAVRQRQTFVSRGSFALKTPWGPRAWVRGYKPATDWAEQGQSEVELLASVAMQRYANDIARRLS